MVVTIGLAGLIIGKNIVSKIISLDVMNVGIVALFVSMSYRKGSLPPIITQNNTTHADPIPQAIVITAIVIGFSTLTLSTTIAVMLSEKLKRTSVKEFERMMDE